ncbi:MAG: D-glycero-beta-D-manno-heptose-7-phosphate kinase [Candidatus Omnitrophica bacterium]|nr:D-glycero-beta-D-manno-heptose-7-phosphate kinase [Candidatus Omnitrophota bacterium]MBU2250820.1 D-glycero-beta-D-manno-heptose-7-phosphate kinase [Candidatus Omnitrophota bacterium]MBU2266161.1 D-glycero-beta-D-manno-heptose-7-phosphate kinase [Candidatus Omnitrophota bacterium]MBU2474160.1 D-glycero-beta-D-manno-heptose-7-phosphate kinase [Candidatus Omnitrophota bacterium]
MKVNKPKLTKIVSRFASKNILVVGDLILDHHIFGKVDRISPEAPVPVVWARNENFTCGGASNVGLNLRALGASSSLSGVVGRDHFGKTLFSHIKSRGIGTGLIIKDNQRPTTIKTRIMAHHQQVVRVDWESVEFLSAKINQAILRKIKANINNFDAVIIEDYGKGVINPNLVEELVDICKTKKKIITVDPKEEHFDYYENVTALTPNLSEAQTAVNTKIRKKSEIEFLGRIIMKKLNPKALLITLGEDGMVLFSGSRTQHIPTQAHEVYDVTGAGDTVIAVFTLALSCGADFHEAAIIANFAAGIVVGKLGAATTDRKELSAKINGYKD